MVAGARWETWFEDRARSLRRSDPQQTEELTTP
jgi:hypothetical protein